MLGDLALRHALLSLRIRAENVLVVRRLGVANERKTQDNDG
jgi:hypothetical protein